VADSSSKPRIALGVDHAGFRAKENIKKYLEGAGSTFKLNVSIKSRRGAS